MCLIPQLSSKLQPSCYLSSLKSLLLKISNEVRNHCFLFCRGVKETFLFEHLEQLCSHMCTTRDKTKAPLQQAVPVSLQGPCLTLFHHYTHRVRQGSLTGLTLAEPQTSQYLILSLYHNIATAQAGCRKVSLTEISF